MSLPGLTASKPCDLDLTLAGSQVTFAHPIKYASGPPALLNGTSNHFAKLTAPSFADRDMALAIEVRKAQGAVTGRRFGQLPPFPSKTRNMQPSTVPCNDSKQIADICHRLTCNAFGSSPVSDAITMLKENSTMLDRSNTSHSAKQSIMSAHSIRSMRPQSLPANEKLIVKTFTPAVISTKTAENATSNEKTTKEIVLGDLKVSSATMLTRIISAERQESVPCSPPPPIGIVSKKKERRKRRRSVKSAGKRRPTSHRVKQISKLSLSHNEEASVKVVPQLEAQCATIRVVNPLPKVNSKSKIHDISNSSCTDSTDSVTNLRKPVAIVKNTDYTNKKEEVVRLTKVFLSDKQSGMLKELGVEVPCAPPATPMPVLHQQYEYIASLNDIRSQRALKSQLEVMDKAVKQKEKAELEEHAKQQKQNIKEQEKIKRKRQRLEIYALNKLMTNFEHSNFEQFCTENGIPCDL